MKYRHDAQPARFGVDLGPVFQTPSHGHPRNDTWTLARIQGMRYMQTKWPRASLVDLQIFLEGWDKGAEWALSVEGGQDFGTQPLAPDEAEN